MRQRRAKGKVAPKISHPQRIGRKQVASKATEDPRRLTHAEYKAEFRLPSKAKGALEHALDIRKFEIELYWKRAAYFWTLIGATLAGYGALQATSSRNQRIEDLSVVLASVGLVLSFGWFCANKGSKQWQENWENHVDLLEDSKIGPLYKVILKRPEEKAPAKWLEDRITGPAPYSVSKINQIISLYISIVWLGLLWNALGSFNRSFDTSFWHLVCALSAILFCVFFRILGRTHEGSHSPVANIRETIILPSKE